MAIHPSASPSPNPASPAYDEDYYDSTSAHPESTTRLAAQHTTEGYRDGITESKHLYIQEGFDEGYILGAALGLKVGELLGILDGLIGTLSGKIAKCEDGGEKERLMESLASQKRVRKDAKIELALEKVFGKEYFGEDGLWKWTVGEEDEGQTFDDIVALHPLVLKWQDIVTERVREMGLELKKDIKDEGAGGSDNQDS